MIGWILEAFPGWLKCVERNKAPVRLPVHYALGDLILVIVSKVLIVYKASIVVSADCTLLFKIYNSSTEASWKGLSHIAHDLYTWCKYYGSECKVDQWETFCRSCDIVVIISVISCLLKNRHRSQRIFTFFDSNLYQTHLKVEKLLLELPSGIYSTTYCKIRFVNFL